MSIRNDWSLDEIRAIMDQPFNDLLFQAHTLHREFHDPNAVQVSTLLSIKTGACPEDCKYCSQSSRYETDIEKERLMPKQQVLDAARAAKEQGASRFCMGAAWRNPTDRNLNSVIEMVSEVKALGMETCLTLGMLSDGQTAKLKEAGLDYYNHNLDTSPEYYPEVITSRTYQDRLDTLSHVRDSGIKICSGGIIGMGEQTSDRASLLRELANLREHPESVPINALVQVEGTPFDGKEELDPIDFIRMVATARIVMPKAVVRLSAGRNDMSEEQQAMCFFAGANSIFYGERLLTTDNPAANSDKALFKKLGISNLIPEGYVEETPAPQPVAQTVHFDLHSGA